MESGAKLYDLLGKEEDLNRSREHVRALLGVARTCSARTSLPSRPRAGVGQAIRFLDAAASNLDNSAEQAHVER